MSKLQMEPPLREGVMPRFFVRVHRRPRPREPWSWEIVEEGRAEPCRRSTRFYRSGDEALAAGQAMLARTGGSPRMVVPAL
jgi:hypothetical protein